MNGCALLDETVQWLTEAPVSGHTLDDKVRQLLQAEYLRKLGQFRRTDMMLTSKYGMNFTRFVEESIAAKMQYSWESETDAMDWEEAVSGIRTIERKLALLRVC